jgi:hypothetical protein
LNELINERKNLFLDVGKKEDISKGISEDCSFYDNTYWNVSSQIEFKDEI